MKWTLLALFSLLISASTFANEFSELKSAVIDARESLLTLLRDPAKRGTDQQTLVKNSANKVSDLFSKAKAPSGKDTLFTEAKKNWDDFKRTRETELVPAILAGKQEDADKIATGIQKERLKIVLRNLDELSK